MKLNPWFASDPMSWENSVVHEILGTVRFSWCVFYLKETCVADFHRSFEVQSTEMYQEWGFAFERTKNLDFGKFTLYSDANQEFNVP